VLTYKVGAFVIEDTYQTAGINDNKQASAIEEYLKEKINNKLMFKWRNYGISPKQLELVLMLL